MSGDSLPVDRIFVSNIVDSIGSTETASHRSPVIDTFAYGQISHCDLYFSVVVISFWISTWTQLQLTNSYQR